MTTADYQRILAPRAFVNGDISVQKTGARVQANGKNWTYTFLSKFKNMTFEICTEIQDDFFFNLIFQGMAGILDDNFSH